MGRIDIYPAQAIDPPAGRYVAGDLLSINSTGAMALSKAAAEQVFMTSNAIATLAGRRYRITALISTTSGGAWTWAQLKVRRGTTTAGTQIANTVHSRPATVGQHAMYVVAYDTPGVQSAQQWCMSHQLDASICDLYGPSFIAVEDVGWA